MSKSILGEYHPPFERVDSLSINGGASVYMDSTGMMLNIDENGDEMDAKYDNVLSFLNAIPALEAERDTLLRENEAAREAITQANAYATSIASYLAIHGFTYNGTEYPKWVEWNRNHPETCPGLTPYPALADKKPK